VTGPPSRSAGSQPPVRAVFFGSGAFALPILGVLLDHADVDLVGLVTPPDRAVGRRGHLTPVPVAAEARRLGLPLLQPDRIRTPEASAAIAALEPDLAVLADFGRLVPPAILDGPRLGFLNVHPSLLPRHRGATPVPATILAGDPEAGVSIMRMDAGLDTGPLLGARSWALDGTETAPALEERASHEGAALLAELLGPYLRGEVAAVPQDEGAATLTRPLRREDGRLDPGLPVAHLERQVRAYQPWPGSFVESAAGRLAVLGAEPAPAQLGDRPGELVADDERGLALAAADGRLRLLEVQAAGGRPMSAAEFRRGHPSVLGALVADRP
jgi:methionyl-tRNA formyltransferase